MNFITKSAVLLLAMAATHLSTSNLVLAHGFQVLLVTPSPNAGTDQWALILNGFMLAIAVSDSHPDQESDGHLVGLDVDVSVLARGRRSATDIADFASAMQVDILVAFGPGKPTPGLQQELRRKNIVLLLSDQAPLLRSVNAAVEKFRLSYGKSFSAKPSTLAAQGYTAGRRIAAAIRAQGGVEDKALLQRNFQASARDFKW